MQGFDWAFDGGLLAVEPHWAMILSRIQIPSCPGIVRELNVGSKALKKAVAVRVFLNGGEEAIRISLPLMPYNVLRLIMPLGSEIVPLIGRSLCMTFSKL